MNQLPQKKRIFSDVTAVSRGAAIVLAESGLITSSNVVVSWTYLNPFLRDRMLGAKEAKQLILLELYRTDGQPVRGDIVDRLVLYLAAISKEDFRAKIAKEMNPKKKAS
jgi:hypothetical protein